jgi:fatty-acyl-CoA synthase
MLAEAAGRASTGVSVLDGRELSTRTWSELVAEARELARARGVRPGAHLGVVGDTSLDFLRVVLATWLGDGCVVLLPPRPRGMSREVYAEQAERRLRAGGASDVWTSADLVPVAACDKASGVGDRAGPDGSETPALIQFSSGTTAEPRAVPVPWRILEPHVRSLVERYCIDESDTVVTWMPTYHDMCFVGFFLAALDSGARLVLRPPAQFAARPTVWLHDLADHQGTLTGAPSTALGLVARAVSMKPPRLTRTLDTLSGLIVGSEVVREPDVAGFQEATAPFGLRPSALRGAYGMTEAVVGVSLARPGCGLSFVDAAGRVGGGPSSGRVGLSGELLPGVELRVAGAANDAGPSNDAGQLLLRGPNIIGSADRFDREGWYRTRDRGFVADGQVAVLGREDDVIVLGGVKHSPQTIEVAAERVDGIRPGGVAAVQLVDDRAGDAGEVVVVVELRSRTDDSVVTELCDRIRAAVGLLPMRLVGVPRGTLPKTTSGKVRRGQVRVDWPRYERVVDSGYRWSPDR